LLVSYLRIFIFIGILPVGLLSASNFLIDPYEVFQTKLLPEVGATQERYLKVEWLKRNRDFDTFLLGGSRMGTTAPRDIEKIIPNSHVYNFFVSSGNQSDNLAHGKWLLATQPKIKTIYVQVDWPESFGLTQASFQYLSHPEVIGKNAYGFQGKFLFYLAYHPIEFKIINNTRRKGEFKLPLESGYYYYPKRDALIEHDCKAYVEQSEWFSHPVMEAAQSAEQRKLLNDSLRALNELVTEARKKSVRVALFITPHHQKFLDKINVQEYVYFLNKLAEISPYWNFGFYSDITKNDCNYYEPSHYIRKVAPLLFTAMSGNAPKSYARYITPENAAMETSFVKDNFHQHRSNK
jgi:hypothetical protein